MSEQQENCLNAEIDLVNQRAPRSKWSRAVT